MNNYLFLLIAIPLVIASLCINIVFWSNHADHAFAKTLAALWAVGLTAVEFIFPAWALHHWRQHRASALMFSIVGGAVAVFSVWVFAMTIDNAIAKPFNALEHQVKTEAQKEEKDALQRQLAERTLDAATVAIKAANRFNEIDKISLGTLPALEKFQELTHQAAQTLHPQEPHASNADGTAHNLHYLLTLSTITGIERHTLKLNLALMLALLIEAAAVMSVMMLTRPQTAPQAATAAVEHAVNTAEPQPAESTPELPPLQQARQDILNGVHGDIPAMSALPKYYQGTGLRFHDFQTLRDEMIAAGELKPLGAKRVTLANTNNTET